MDQLPIPAQPARLVDWLFHTKSDPHAGMGAIPYPGGVAFRVWAPFARRVAVKGEFNGWSETRHRLANEGNGYWYAAVKGARPGQGYLFVIEAANGDRLSRIDPYAMQVTNSVGHGIILDHAAFDWQGVTFERPALQHMVIYEMHVGSFIQPTPGKPGEFDLVEGKIDYLKRLGVNAVQIMPVAEFAGDLSWGYNPSHIFAVESSYGGPHALKTLVRELHRNGIAVILDVVYNHFGPSDLDLWRFDGWSENGKGGIYFYNDDRSSTPWGDTRPDYGRGEVRQFIRDNALMWLEHYRIDGLRFDMTLYIRSRTGSGDDISEGWSLMQWINREIRERFPAAITISEDLRNNAWLTKNPDQGGAGFHAQWDANFVHPVRETVIVASDDQRSMAKVSDALLHSYDGDSFRRVIYSESHDEVANGKARVPQEIDPGDSEGWFAQKRSTLAAGLVFTAPGIPMLFQGQEFLQAGWFRDDIPLDWDNAEKFRGIVRLYRDLIALRRDTRGLTPGLSGHGVHIHHVNDVQNVVAFRRFHTDGTGGETVIVMNFGTAPIGNYRIGFPAAGEWKVRLNSDSRFYSEMFKDFADPEVMAAPEPYDGLGASASLAVAPYSFLILSQD